MTTFTEAVATQVKHLLEDEDNDNLKLRIYVTGGGCSGFKYGFTFDDIINEDDTIVTQHDITLLIDTTSISYLKDATIDYTTNIAGSQFVISNPGATSTCGCGSSFAV
jgi:iron-sulfur cluster insertion protein